jgi:diguanylate cyclase (GGDEF)-like protein/PAS domain S-box-containing protein
MENVKGAAKAGPSPPERALGSGSHLPDHPSTGLSSIHAAEKVRRSEIATVSIASTDHAADAMEQSTRDIALPSLRDGQTLATAAEALLREHPDALVCGLAGNGLIVPVPQSVGLWGQGLIEGRALVDNVVAGDRTTVVRLWLRAQEEGAAAARVRMLRMPSTWATLHFLDLREIHGVLLGVVIPSEEDAADEGKERELTPASPRFCSLMEDEGAKVLHCDEAFTEMFGYTLEELLGESVLEQIHPDDQGRAVEGWLAVLSTRRDQQTRLRRRRKDGTWMWVDTTLRNFLNHPGRNYVLVELIDISAEMQAQEILQEREELLRRLTNAMPVGLLHLDNERGVVYHNARLLDILYGSDAPMTEPAPLEETVTGAATAGGPDPEATSTGTLLKTLSVEGMAAFDRALAEVLTEGVDRDVEVDIELPCGAWRRALMSLRALLRPNGEANGAIVCVLDVTDSARVRQELEHRATVDPLTNTHNRSSILGALERELACGGSARTGVIYVDLDEFKPVNDTLGHAAGDELLGLVAKRLAQASRDSDLVGRLGGDEFLVLLHDVSGPDVAVRVAERIREGLCDTFELDVGSIELRASIGVACAESATVTPEELVRRADQAMYRSKEQGQSRPVLAT